MTPMLDEHEIRGAVERLAAEAATTPPPRQAILTAGARRRTRRRVGAAGAAVLAATLAVSVSWSAASSHGSSASPAAGWPTTTNAFTEQLGRTLEQALPGAKVSASMFANTNPAARHDRFDVFPVRITYRGHDSEAFLTMRAFTPVVEGADSSAIVRCQPSMPPVWSASGCVTKDLAGGGTVHAEILQGAGSWTSTSGALGEGTEPLTIVEGDVNIAHSGAWAMLQVRGGAHVNDSALTPSKLSAALGDPRFTAVVADFAAHPEHDPYGPVAQSHGNIVASGTIGTHTWSLSFSTVSRTGPHDITQVLSDCNYWNYVVDGKSLSPDPDYACGPDGSRHFNPPPTDKAQPAPANLLYTSGSPSQLIGSVLTSTVPSGTASVQAVFDDHSPELTAKTFTIHGDVPFFALVKPDSAKAAWKATVRCLDASGKELATLYFIAPTVTPPSASAPTK